MWFLALGINIQHRDHYYSWEYHGKRGEMVVVLENKTSEVKLKGGPEERRPGEA